MRGERPGHSLQATALVDEAFLRLVDTQHVNWQNRTHFLAVAARLMRRILVDHARSRRYQKRGGGRVDVTLDVALVVTDESRPDLVALDDALTALAEIDERKSSVIELRFFGGLSVEETAFLPEGVGRDGQARLAAGQEMARTRDAQGLNRAIYLPCLAAAAARSRCSECQLLSCGHVPTSWSTAPVVPNSGDV
jgi:RNA polymerase sigma factor (sigma-70 family)